MCLIDMWHKIHLQQRSLPNKLNSFLKNINHNSSLDKVHIVSYLKKFHLNIFYNCLFDQKHNYFYIRNRFLMNIQHNLRRNHSISYQNLSNTDLNHMSNQPYILNNFNFLQNNQDYIVYISHYHWRSFDGKLHIHFLNTYHNIYHSWYKFLVSNIRKSNNSNMFDSEQSYLYILSTQNQSNKLVIKHHMKMCKIHIQMNREYTNYLVDKFNSDRLKLDIFSQIHNQWYKYHMFDLICTLRNFQCKTNIYLLIRRNRLDRLHIWLDLNFILNWNCIKYTNFYHILHMFCHKSSKLLLNRIYHLHRLNN